MLNLIVLAALAIGLYIGFRLGVWYANSPARRAASAMKNGAQGSWKGAKSLYQKFKDMLGNDKTKGSNGKERK